jgi:outer membrane protein assembly factor BamD (BamD/ComL family)
MVMASGLAALLASAAGAAPVQCGQSGDDLRMEDDPGEALWMLATRFEQEGNHAAALETWSTIADRYPSNRHAAEARRLSSSPGYGGAHDAG